MKYPSTANTTSATGNRVRAGQLLLALVCVLLVSLSFAQPKVVVKNDTLSKAKTVAAQALTSYKGTVMNTDQPLWREALTLGQTALSEHPGDPETLHFLATSYGYVRWYVRAWQHWQRYFEAGGTLASANQLDANSSQLFAEAGTELGFARYQANELRAALPFYEGVFSYLPENTEALRWLGRIHLELGDPDQAVLYWRHLTDLRPNDESAAYYLALSEEQREVGTAASSAFQAGIRAYEAKDLSTALSAFQAAIAANSAFTNAYVWAGRSSLELGQAELAESYWRRVIELDPSDERALYFARLAEAERLWGRDAASAFFEGQALHLQNDFAAAAKRFEAAFNLNPAYTEAAVWAARSFQESEQTDKAIYYWRTVTELDPDDKRATDFLRLALRQDTYGIDAGAAFVEGVAAFESADLATAEARFGEALNADETFAEAWAWLGRIYFSRADYARAAGAYERASGLEPGNEGYRFFAREARTLATPETLATESTPDTSSDPATLERGHARNTTDPSDTAAPDTETTETNEAPADNE